MQPAAPGAWQWLNGRTLQFRPADPWRELTPVEISGPQISAKLIPLLATPESTSPEANAEPVTDLNRIVLTFAAPVDINALSRLTSIEVRPSPGLSPLGGQFLAPQDFVIRPLERAKRDDKQSYVVQFKSAIPDGRVAILRLRLSDQPGLRDR